MAANDRERAPTPNIHSVCRLEPMYRLADDAGIEIYNPCHNLSICVTTQANNNLTSEVEGHILQKRPVKGFVINYYLNCESPTFPNPGKFLQIVSLDRNPFPSAISVAHVYV